MFFKVGKELRSVPLIVKLILMRCKKPKVFLDPSHEEIFIHPLGLRLIYERKDILFFLSLFERKRSTVSEILKELLGHF